MKIIGKFLGYTMTLRIVVWIMIINEWVFFGKLSIVGQHSSLNTDEYSSRIISDTAVVRFAVFCQSELNRCQVLLFAEGKVQTAPCGNTSGNNLCL